MIRMKISMISLILSHQLLCVLCFGDVYFWAVFVFGFGIKKRKSLSMFVYSSHNFNLKASTPFK